ncbi:MAG: TolC family protein [Deltaproteobacteria bacterium]|nr:TolC family protein [Deltaproteobacteria bacterium]
MRPRTRSTTFLLAAVALALGHATEASALQPLEDFTRAARTGNLDTRDARLTAEQRGHEVDGALGRVLPSLSVSAGYTRNQLEVSVSRPGGGGGVESAIISPLDQVDASVTLRVPLIDVGAWRRLGAARETEAAAKLRVAATDHDTDAEIARLYYTIVGATWLRDATQKSLEAAEKNLAVIVHRREAERALETDVLRARAEVERARSQLADAERLLRSGGRALWLATGLEATPGAPALTPGPTQLAAKPGELATKILATPVVRAAEHDVTAAEKSRSAAWAALFPTLGASATERLTNATGFAGRNALYNVQLTATFNLDYATVAQARAAETGAALARSRAERARRVQQDLAEDAASRVETEAVRLAAATVEERAAAAVVMALRERLAAGTAMLHEVVQAERDALSATATRIQAAADLEFARALLVARTKGVEP